MNRLNRDSNLLARVALLQMLDEAGATGLKMRSLEEMKASAIWDKTFKASFDIPQAVVKSLNDYIAPLNTSR